MKQLKVGAGKCTIDPPKEAYPFPSNFGMCDEIYNSCYVRALAITNGEKKILYVVYELSDLPKVDDLEKQLADLWDISTDDLVLAVTHNHTSPNDRSKFPAPEEKFELFRQIELEAGKKAVTQAIDSLQPADYGFGEINSYCNVNRDLKTRFGFWVEGPNYGGYSDKRLALIKFTDNEGKLIATLMNYPAHATCAFVQKDKDGKIKTAGNFPGIACQFVEDYYGNDAVAIWTSGCAGNQDPILFDYEWYEYTDGYITKIERVDGSGYLNMEILGRKQGSDAISCLDQIEVKSGEDVDIQYLHSLVPVPTRQQVNVSKDHHPFGIRMGGEGERTDFSAPKMPELPVYEPTGEFMDYTLDLMTIGDIEILLTSGELYSEIGRDMMKACDNYQGFIVTHIPGNSGYTLDKSSADHLNFQAFGPVAPGDADEPLINKAKELHQAVKNQ